MSERLYEGMFLLDANETAKNWAELEAHIGTLLTKNQARLEYGERWPDQKLAYPVQGVRKGSYFLTYFRTTTDRIDELRRDAELSEHILRLLVVQEEFLEEEMQRRRDAAARRAKAEREAPPPAAARTEDLQESTPEAPDAETLEVDAGDDAEVQADVGEADEEEGASSEQPRDTEA
ncbi:MAG: 30S ribosomal protein S6 [Planctomycetota bacterium]